jgi:hypothetical protein
MANGNDRVRSAVRGVPHHGDGHHCPQFAGGFDLVAWMFSCQRDRPRSDQPQGGLRLGFSPKVSPLSRYERRPCDETGRVFTPEVPPCVR